MCRVIVLVLVSAFAAVNMLMGGTKATALRRLRVDDS